jgi:hypothetical protein
MVLCSPGSICATLVDLAVFVRRPGREFASPDPQRERKMQGFKSRAAAQRFLTTHAAIYNAFAYHRHPASRRSLRVFQARFSQAWAAAIA